MFDIVGDGMFDPKVIRKDFPILSRKVKGKRLIYFDNAATSQKPIQVIEAVANYYKYYNSNVHRAVHTLSQEASQKYEDAHEVVARFIGADSYREIVFVKNATEGTNLVAYSLGLHEFSEGDEVIVTLMDHHSNIVPWHIISKVKGIKIYTVGIDEEGKIDLDDLASKLSSRTKIVCVPHVSNVLGTINDVKTIAKMAHEVGAYILVDGAQSVPHMPVNVKSLDVDFLVFSGHKMLGPMGIGVLYGKEEVLEDMEPFLGGGDMISSVSARLEGGFSVKYNDLPWKFEAGTPNVAGAVGLMEAIKYLDNLGMDNVHAYERDLVKYTLELMEELEGVEIYGPMNPNSRSGVVAFNIVGLGGHETASLLDDYGIMVRSGHHCAQPLHEYYNISNSARASYYIYNLKEEIDIFIEALRDILVISSEL